MVDRFSSDGVRKTGVRYYCENCSSSAHRNFPHGRWCKLEDDHEKIDDDYDLHSSCDEYIDDFEMCSNCLKEFEDPSSEISYVADRLSPDRVLKTGVMYFCKDCSVVANKKFPDGRWFSIES